ncbi:hypothetical protein Malapachy_3326 [Malassezia pachydermatis]|uniref:Uncharacterized protein n=1 Tax=Malassezia pachydermatis TaxID=77020 RepID=A0A0M8MWU8_9BASI|nr:hypothetical protein Malapachy_3326 [Malassezia pachydermatis]KOS15894.1 hypothetical protein Malapachy_3326 [Malassezia pachydermatis]
MPLLVVPPNTVAALQAILARDDVPPSLRDDLQAALRPAPLHGATPADLSVTETCLPHQVLVDVAHWAQTKNEPTLALSELVRGTSLYFKPPPVYQRPPELDASLEAIQRAHDEKEYARMTAAPPPAAWKATTLATLYPPSREAAQAERVAWRQTRAQMSAVLNIMLSMGAVATAAWWAGGTASPIWVRWQSMKS